MSANYRGIVTAADDENPLERPAEIYSAFDGAEIKRLRTYVADVESLTKYSLFDGGAGTSWKVSAAEGEPVMEELEFAGDEAVSAVVGHLRQLYNHDEPTSYNQILKLLGRHAHERDSERRQAAHDALKDLRKWEQEATKIGGGLEINIDGEVLTGETLMDLFLHGHYLHKGNEKSDRLDAFPLRGLLLREFIIMLTNLMRVYWVGRNVVAAVLDAPSLVPALVSLPPVRFGTAQGTA